MTTSKSTEKKAKALIRKHHTIAAIKLVREVEGLGLKESKDICEAWRDEIFPPTPSPQVFDLPKLKLEVALEVAAKALDHPTHPMNTRSGRPETLIPTRELCLLHEKAQRCAAVEKALQLHLDFLATLPHGWLSKTTSDIGLLNDAYIESRKLGMKLG